MIYLHNLEDLRRLALFFKNSGAAECLAQRINASQTDHLDESMTLLLFKILTFSFLKRDPRSLDPGFELPSARAIYESVCSVGGINLAFLPTRDLKAVQQLILISAALAQEEKDYLQCSQCLQLVHMSFSPSELQTLARGFMGTAHRGTLNQVLSEVNEEIRRHCLAPSGLPIVSSLGTLKKRLLDLSADDFAWEEVPYIFGMDDLQLGSSVINPMDVDIPSSLDSDSEDLQAAGAEEPAAAAGEISSLLANTPPLPNDSAFSILEPFFFPLGFLEIFSLILILVKLYFFRKTFDAAIAFLGKKVKSFF